MPLLLAALAPVPALSQDSSGLADLPLVPPAVSCADLLGTDLADIGGEGSRVIAAEEVTNDDGIAACSVTGTLAPAITFAVVLPTETWTGRYLQLGCGGLCGRLSIREVGAASGCQVLNAGGFAVASTDMGHQASDETWGSDPQKRADFAHRAHHLTAQASKRLIEVFYGQPAQFSYFVGCSDGGREALIAAQRYPEDFDGIIAGAPAMNLQIQNAVYHAWQARANRDANGRAILLASRLPLLHEAVLAQCDGLDGLEDGLLADPLACTPDLAAITCPEGATDTATCLTPAEAEAARRLYDGPRDPETGARLTVGGPMPGSELRWAGLFVPEEPDGEVSSASHASEYLEQLAFPIGEEAPTVEEIEFTEEYLDQLAELHPLYDATNPDLSGLQAAGGKLILYHGWSDTDISPLNTITYVEAVRDLLGEEAADDHLRLYLIPGMYHCSQGEGPYEFDLLTPLMAWVEGGTAPGAVEARQPVQGEASGFGQFAGPQGGPPAQGTAAEPPGYPAASLPSAEVVRTRPLLPYPALPAFTGEGDPNDAASWTTGDATVAFTPVDWAGAAFFQPYEAMERP